MANAPKRTIREDLAAAGLMPEGEHGVPGPGGDPLPATSSGRGPNLALDGLSPRALHGGGFHVVSIKAGEEEGGVTSHRGVLHEDEYVDATALQALVEQELGFTYEQIRSVYRQGRLSADQRELRGQIDARLLALSRAGGNLTELGRALGFHVDTYGNCKPVKEAVARAIKEES